MGTTGPAAAMTNGLEYYNACWCAGTGCGGHLVLNPAMSSLTITPIGWQGAAQHAYTHACAGFRAPGSCPPGQAVQVGYGTAAKDK